LNAPALTILLPLRYYHHIYLRKALDSIVGQTCPYWNMLVGVDAENFSTFKNLLLKDLTDSRISMIENEGRQLAGKLNTGMRHARTSFVAILAGDDMWSPDAVAVLSEHISNFSGIDFFHSSRIFIDENENPISSIYYSRESFNLEDFFFTSPVKYLLCWRRGGALSFGAMDESLNSVGVDDFDFPWSMAERGARFMAIKEPLYLARDHRDGFRLTTHLPLSVHIEEIKRIMRKHGAPEATIRKRVRIAKKGYLRQCLYRSPFNKWLKEMLGYDPRRGWRQTYR
jgi:glycosyltransferase involved in cell wall biosynthesis